MPCYLGIDTSNYTTSAALYISEENRVISEKMLLPVAEKQCGLRQSDAVFAHTKQLHSVIERLFSGDFRKIDGVCVSTRPRSVEGSYMPAFLVGENVARSIATANNVPCYSCSHQEGHVVSALYSADRLSLLNERFFAFHVSGGTTECLLSSPKNGLVELELVAKTLDINAGQLIDRAGVMMGLPFPSGAELEKLALKFDGEIKVKTSFKGLDCNMSGAQNKLEALYNKTADKPQTARYAIEYVKAVISEMTERVFEKFGSLPIIYAGGVMSNKIIREYIENNYGGVFAEPRFSSDNAAGVSIIASVKDKLKG